MDLNRMFAQSWGGYISVDLFSSFALEVLLVLLCYTLASFLRAWSSAPSEGKRRGGSEKVAGVKESSACSPGDVQMEETSQLRSPRRDASINDPGACPAPVAGKHPPETSQLRSPRRDASINDPGACPAPVAGKHPPAPGAPPKFPQKEAASIAEVCAALKTKNWNRAMESIHRMYQQDIYPSASFYGHVMQMAKWGKEWELVVATFLLMQAHGVTPWVTAWKLYCTATDYIQSRAEERRRAEEQRAPSLEERGFKSEVSTYRFIIYMYGIDTAPYPDFARLQKLVGQLQRAKHCLTTSTYNAMLAACQAPPRLGFASDIFAAMQRCGCVPDIFTFTVLVRICAREASTSASRQLLSQLLNEHFTSEAHAHAALDALEGEKDWTVALDILESMRHHGITIHAEAYRKVVRGFQTSKQFDFAIQVAEECVSRSPRLESLDLPFYSFLLSCCDECNNSDKALFFFGEMQRYHAPGVEEYNALLGCLLKCNREADAVQQVLVEMDSAGVKKDSRTESILAMRRATADSQ